MHISGILISHLLLLAATSPNLVTSSPVPPTGTSYTTGVSPFARAVDPFQSLRSVNINLISQSRSPGNVKADSAAAGKSALVSASTPKRTSTLASAPRFAVYAIDGIPPASSIKGIFNVLILAFLNGGKQTTGAGTDDTGVVQTWVGMSADDRQVYKDAGITVLVSAFGATPRPTTWNWDPTNSANIIAQWVKANGVDGVDVDYEDLEALNGGSGAAETWVITFTTQLKNQLGDGFNGKYGGGAYNKIDQTVGSMIDWYHVQFYNTGPAFENCQDLVQQSVDQTAVLQIHNVANVPLNKIVIGKPVTQPDGNDGYIDATTLSSCMQMATNGTGWNSGIVLWKYGDDANQVMTEARKLAFPVQ
ncbi:glycoside hydrolase superfamily [Mycena epipterygia]|nr:glycoside hydrolase superfamily [Mycena epipterygia]